jgi:hypothetical protein
MNHPVTVGLPAVALRHVVAQVLPDTSPFASEAQFVADEILRLCDADQLSERTVGDICTEIYQRGMHSAHIGGFQLTVPIQQLEGQLNRDRGRGRLPQIQVDLVMVHPRIADIAAGILLPLAPHSDVSAPVGLLPSRPPLR